MRELRPLYCQLHTWTKHELARATVKPVPQRHPTHWLNNRLEPKLDRPHRRRKSDETIQKPDLRNGSSKNC